jgi:hypothetical protein
MNELLPETWYTISYRNAELLAKRHPDINKVWDDICNGSLRGMRIINGITADDWMEIVYRAAVTKDFPRVWPPR